MLPVQGAFGDDVDYAQLVKVYGAPRDSRSATPECIGCHKRPVIGNPDPAHISTSFVERSEPVDAHAHAPLHAPHQRALKEAQEPPHAISLYFTFYNWTRIHKTLRITPAMAAGLTDRVWDMDEIVALMDEVAPKPGRPKTYKKRVT